ncbi:MAG TPA: helix-turn-helix domain-containing protein, partial [Actinomycetota bacterium]
MRTTDGAERVVTILDLLGSTPDGMGVSAIAEELGVHRSTTSRLMGTLAASGIVERDAATR